MSPAENNVNPESAPLETQSDSDRETNTERQEQSVIESQERLDGESRTETSGVDATASSAGQNSASATVSVSQESAAVAGTSETSLPGSSTTQQSTSPDNVNVSTVPDEQPPPYSEPTGSLWTTDGTASGGGGFRYWKLPSPGERPPPYATLDGESNPAFDPGYDAAVVMDQPQPRVELVLDPSYYGQSPKTVVCPICSQRIMTKTKKEVGTAAWLGCAGLCIIGCWICCWIPLVLPVCHNVIHQCPQCKSQIGIYKHI